MPKHEGLGYGQIKCDYCENIGHISDRCWSLHPELMPKKLQDKKGKQQHSTSSDSESDDGVSSNSNIDGEDIEEWDPDDEDMGLDIDNDYGDL